MKGPVGVLALQGGFGLHVEACRRLGYEVREVRDPDDLTGLAVLVLPGGESTTMGLLLERRALVDPLRRAIAAGLPVFGTCAGAILLANTIVGSNQLRIGGLDVSIERNAYGSQVDSFGTDLTVEGIPGVTSVPGVFIRAPRIVSVGPGVEVLARHGGFPVLVRQENLVAATFHPELTESLEVHQWFLRQFSIPPKEMTGTFK